MPKLTMLVGPPGSGKSTFAKDLVQNDWDNGANTVYVNQDSQGKFGHMEMFRESLHEGKNIICDRMNFNKIQRKGYLDQAKANGYETKIVVLHVPKAVCAERAIKRDNHPTIQDEYVANRAIEFFFKSYERPTPDEADEIQFVYPEGVKPKVVVCDLDGTLADCSHRIHHVRGEGKKNWPAFMDGIPNDKVNYWCADLLRGLADQYKIVYCSGRSDDNGAATEEWLKKHQLLSFWDNLFEREVFADLYMRPTKDSRQDYVIKEIILDFEILTRYSPVMFIDDRKQVVDLWRRRGFVCLQCAEGDF